MTSELRVKDHQAQKKTCTMSKNHVEKQGDLNSSDVFWVAENILQLDRGYGCTASSTYKND